MSGCWASRTLPAALRCAGARSPTQLVTRIIWSDSTEAAPQHTPAIRLWFGEVRNAPGYRSLPHHHGEAETGGRVVSGAGRIYPGENYEQWWDMAEGDWVFLPSHMPYVECNMSTTEDLVRITYRTPENIVVNLPDDDDSVLAGYCRA